MNTTRKALAADPNPIFFSKVDLLNSALESAKVLLSKVWSLHNCIYITQDRISKFSRYCPGSNDGLSNDGPLPSISARNHIRTSHFWRYSSRSPWTRDLDISCPWNAGPRVGEPSLSRLVPRCSTVDRFQYGEICLRASKSCSCWSW